MQYVVYCCIFNVELSGTCAAAAPWKLYRFLFFSFFGMILPSVHYCGELLESVKSLYRSLVKLS